MKKDFFVELIMDMDVNGLHFTPHKPKGITCKPEENLTIRISPKNSELDACGNRLGLHCKVHQSLRITKQQYLFIQEFTKNKRMIQTAQNMLLPYQQSDMLLIDEYGYIQDGFTPMRHMCPKDIFDLLNQAEIDLYSNANRFLKLLRWRQDFDSAGEVLNRGAIYWGTDEGPFAFAPQPWHNQEVRFQAMHGIHWSETHSSDLNNLWHIKDLDEPLGHTLLREAKLLIEVSPHSCILILASSLEAAVKIHISKISGSNSWFMEQRSIPPVHSLLKDYIPTIHKELNHDISFWDIKKINVAEVDKFFQVRNKVAHTGKIPAKAKPLNFYIELITDFLYLLDVLEGHEWAKTLVSTDLRKKLGWPPPKDNRIQISIGCKPPT